MVRCKFKVQSKTENDGGTAGITLVPVCTGSEENKQFFKYLVETDPPKQESATSKPQASTLPQQQQSNYSVQQEDSWIKRRDGWLR